jgi:sucrose phosphorylase
MQTVKDLLVFIYGTRKGQEANTKVDALLEKWSSHFDSIASSYTPGGLPLSEKDAFLITYGDQFRQTGQYPLATLEQFANQFLDGVIDGVHILPFFPYSSDDGFSIIDYREVDPELGTWKEIESISSDFRLAADLVLNHCSAQSEWFRRFLAGEEKYRDFFISMDPDTDLSMIVRPRALPLLTPFETEGGTEHVWTTFSDDQVDLNFHNPDVLIEMLDIFLLYLSKGAQVIRLDAIAYLWKEVGHPSIHHEKTHAVVKLFRLICEELAPWTVLLTETNVPHKENLSYFGNGKDEAHMVYQFSLPPLVLDSFLRGDADHLRKWAASLRTPSDQVTFFNFLASHDGIGLLPAHGILEEREIDALIEEVKQRKGLVSYKSTPEGEIPYELNINYRDAIAGDEPDYERAAKKFLASQAVMLSLKGVPGIYVHSLIGSGNYLEGVKQTGRNRTINREKLEYEPVVEELNTEGTLRNLIYNGFKRMLTVRREHKAFHPVGGQEIIASEGPLFAVLRIAPDEAERILCIINTGGNTERFSLAAGLREQVERTAEAVRSGSHTPSDLPSRVQDLLSGRWFSLENEQEGWTVEPFDVLWLTPR